MSDTTQPAATEAVLSPENAPAASQPMTAREELVDSLKFFAGLAIAVFIFRSFFLSPFNIPSESMQPRLLIGDYLLVNKMAYGYTKHSLPFSMPLIPGRLFARTPERGDVVVFKAPPGNSEDYIKRVIGIPGDTVQMRDGIVWLNGNPVPRVRLADAIIPVTENMLEAQRQEYREAGIEPREDMLQPCFSAEFDTVDSVGRRVCRYPQFRETLPGGPSYDVLELIDQDKDNTAPVTIKAGELFLMGDNRDRSADSRFLPIEGKGIGVVPEDNLVGKAMVGMFSTDGSASWFNPISWFTAARWDRIGDGF